MPEMKGESELFPDGAGLQPFVAVFPLPPGLAAEAGMEGALGTKTGAKKAARISPGGCEVLR
jgi:hypothetical protein